MQDLQSAFAKFDCVVFDAGGVILNWKPAEIVARAVEDSRTRERLLAATIAHEQWHRFDQGLVTLEDLKSTTCIRAQIDAALFDRFYAEVLRSLTPISETVAALKELRRLKKKLILLSNMPGPVWQHLSATYEFWSLFDGLVLSYELRLIKPDPKIYEHLLGTFTVEPGRSVFLDDRLENVEAAHAVGMHAVQFHSMAQAIQELLAGRSAGKRTC